MAGDELLEKHGMGLGQGGVVDGIGWGGHGAGRFKFEDSRFKLGQPQTRDLVCYPAMVADDVRRLWWEFQV